MKINKQTNAHYETRFVIDIFTNKSMLLFGHQVYQLTELHHSFIKAFIVWSAVDDIYFALCLIMIYNTLNYAHTMSLLFFLFPPSFLFMIILITLKYNKET